MLDILEGVLYLFNLFFYIFFLQKKNIKYKMQQQVLGFYFLYSSFFGMQVCFFLLYEGAVTCE